MRRYLRLLLVLPLVASALAVAAGEPGVGADPPAEPPQGEERPAAEAPYGRTPDALVPYNRSAEPYRRFFLTPLVYRGPGREAPAPRGLSAVRIGLLAPLEGTDWAWAGQNMKRGVDLALEEANAAGGYRGLPFELVPKNDQALWGSSSNTLVEFAYEDGVWALIGSIDSNSTHVALRAALKAEVVMVNVGSSDPTVTETGIPWLVRCTPDDRQTSYRLARLVFEERGFTRVAVLRSSNRYGRFGVKEFRDAARRMARPLPMEIQFPPGAKSFTSQLERLQASDVEAVVLWADARAAGLIVRAMRARGMSQEVFGTDRMVAPLFLELAGEAARGATATFWMDPGRSDEEWVAFRQRYRERFELEPDVYAAYSYDAARLVVESIRQAGLNRARIRDALMDRRSYTGVTGTMEFDTTSNNVAAPILARVEGGRFVFR